MGDIKKKRDAKEKAFIAIEAIKGELTAAQISSKYGVNAGQISTWKKQLLDGAIDIFSGKHVKRDKSNDALVDDLYKQIGQLSVERDWLKKKSNLFS
ncbi:transposase [Gammaproteobacteria bacterium]